MRYLYSVSFWSTITLYNIACLQGGFCFYGADSKPPRIRGTSPFAKRRDGTTQPVANNYVPETNQTSFNAIEQFGDTKPTLGVTAQGGDYKTGLGYYGKSKWKCQMVNYCWRPFYPSITDVKNNENLPAGQREEDMSHFFNIAKYWSIIEILDTTSPLLPRWTLTATTEQARDPDGNQPGFAVGGKAKHFVSMDHLYEIKLVDEFFLHLIADFGVSCDLLKGFFDQPGINGHDSRLTDFYSNLPTYANPEFVGMDDRINQAKAKIWENSGANSNNSPMKLNNGPGDAAIDNNKDALAEFAISLSLINDYRVRPLFHMTNARFHTRLTAINLAWGNAYRAWMINKIYQRNIVLQQVASRVINSIPTSPTDPRAAQYPVQRPRWSSFMSSLLATYPVADMTIPSVPQWAVVAEATGTVANLNTPTGAHHVIRAESSAQGSLEKAEILGSRIQTLQFPTITAAPT